MARAAGGQGVPQKRKRLPCTTYRGFFALMEAEEHDDAAFQAATDTLEQTVDKIEATDSW